MKNIATHIHHLLALIFIAASLWISPAWSTTIISGVTNITGNTWVYDYSVGNDALGLQIEEFTVFFDAALYQNLSVAASPLDWDSIVIQPDPQLPADGFFDSLALAAGIDVGTSLSGFSVQFEYLGTGTPGVQSFEIVDPVTFQTLDFGTTQFVPVPPAIWLMISGLSLLASRASKRAKQRPFCG